MIILTKNENGLVKAYEDIEDIFTYNRDIYFFLEYLPITYYEDISKISKEIIEFRKKCMETINAPLIALKNYTEHRVSWERAGMMCGLHIFGLREYCKNKNVDWGDLRIDEYYGFTGRNAIEKIKKNWEKLDPKHEVHPIQYSGKSLYTKYSLTETSKNEDYYNDATINYINYKSKMLISEYVCEFYKSLNQFLENNPEYEDEVNFYRGHRINKDLKKVQEGIIITKKDDLDFLEFKLDLCKLFLKDGVENNNLENILNSYYKLKDILVDEHYHYSIREYMKPKQETAELMINIDSSKGED